MENKSGIREDDLRKKVDALKVRAKAHGVDLKPGLEITVVVEMLIDRLDAYRDTPAYKGRILID